MVLLNHVDHSVDDHMLKELSRVFHQRITRIRLRSGRIEARSGLRMMPTFPRSSLSFRTAGFPRYGCKAGISSGAFPDATRALSLLPTSAPCRPVCIHPSCTSWSNACPAQCRDADSIVHRRKAVSPLLPQGSSLLPELCCLGPSSLNRPHPPHSQAHRDFAAERLIRDVFAVRERRGDPRVVPSFRCTFLPDMPPSTGLSR